MFSSFGFEQFVQSGAVIMQSNIIWYSYSTAVTEEYNQSLNEQKDSIPRLQGWAISSWVNYRVSIVRIWEKIYHVTMAFPGVPFINMD